MYQSTLITELESLGHDFKASVVAAELAENGVAPDTILFRNQSTFKRPVSKDIEDVYWHDTADDDQPDLVFELNREGIYDMLPEALFHNQSVKHEPDEHGKPGYELRQQEKAARKFFSPLENEFHHRALKLDTIERELLKNSNPARNREFFDYFFGDSSILTDHQVLVLMHILPLCHKIRGDLNLIALTLTKILNYAVSISQHWIRQHYALPDGAGHRLRNGTLGADTMLNDQFTIPSRSFDVGISGISGQDYVHFTGRGRHINVLNFILPYFFPADANYSISLQCNTGQTGLMTGDGPGSFLGFNSYI